MAGLINPRTFCAKRAAVQSVEMGMPMEDAVKKFMVLYMASGAEFERMMKNSTPEQQKKGMDAWMKWMNANKASIVEDGAPLGKTKRVDTNGASNTKNEIGGYSIVQAESHDAAAKLFGKDHPHLQMPGAWIEIVEIMPMPGA
jgi:YCII-related domain